MKGIYRFTYYTYDVVLYNLAQYNAAFMSLIISSSLSAHLYFILVSNYCMYLSVSCIFGQVVKPSAICRSLWGTQTKRSGVSSDLLLLLYTRLHKPHIIIDLMNWCLIWRLLLVGSLKLLASTVIIQSSVRVKGHGLIVGRLIATNLLVFRMPSKIWRMGIKSITKSLLFECLTNWLTDAN